MTDPTDRLPEPDPRDELASAHLDGATTPEEAAQVAADPGLRARSEAFGAVRRALGQLDDGPVDEDRRESAIAAALALFDVDDALPAAEDPSYDDLVWLEPVRARRRHMWPVRLAAAAAIIAILGVAAAPLIGRDGDRGTITASPGLDARAERDAGGGAGAADSGFAEDSAAALSPETMMSISILTIADATDLGPVPDLPGLATAARELLDGVRTSPPATVPVDPLPIDRCLAALQAEVGNLVLAVVVGVVDGREVLAVVVPEPDGSRHLEVAAADGCERLGAVPL